MHILNNILLRRKHLLIIDYEDVNHQQTNKEKSFIIAMMKNIQSLGFTFSKELFDKLSTLNYKQLSLVYTELLPALKKIVGADVKYKPMYPNFPKQVEEMEDIDLLINALVHYWSFGILMPEYEKDERLPLIDDNKNIVLSTGNREDLMEIFKNLVSSKTSLSQQDKEDVEAIIESCPDYTSYLPEEIPLKENVALVGKIIFEKAPIKSSSSISRYFSTATDVLRLITALSDGDISLASKTKYRNLKRYERRMILDLLANCGNIVEDLFRYRYEWIRVAEIIHPFEYNSLKYERVYKAFYILRNKKKPLMFGGKVQQAILNNDIDTATDLLKSRPGEFARKLDKLLRDSKDQKSVVEKFRDVSLEVSTPVLLQVRQHFIGRMAELPNPVRVFFPKGNLAKAMSIQNELLPIDKTICQNVIKVCEDALREQYKNREDLGKVYIDAELKNHLVPFSQRSASKTSKSLVRGSQLPIKSDATAVRAFIWWTNTANNNYPRVDIDLSAAIYDSDWNYVEHISYTRLRSSKLTAYHSGDIINGGSVNGDGVSEFLDVNIDAVAEKGRYIVYQIYNYTGQLFSSLENCRFGWMEREDVNSGEIFEPTTVNMVMDVNAEGTTAIPVIFDCVERKFIWCDMNLAIERNHYGGNNLESNLSGVTATCYALTHLNKPNLYDLVMLNTKARGTIVEDYNDADIIFSNRDIVPYEFVVENENKVVKEKNNVPIISSYDTDYFMGNLL